MGKKCVNISLFTTKICAKKSCSSWAESYLEKQGFEAQKKTEKHTFKISISVKNEKKIFI